MVVDSEADRIRIVGGWVTLLTIDDNAMDSAVRFLRNVRARIMRYVKPKSGYRLFSSTSIANLDPLSSRYGYDRGTPVDRYYIERFMDRVREDVRGVCLEITDNAYTVRYGGNQVSRSDVLDIDSGNRHATIVADLRKAPAIPDESYDTVIATHTFGVIDDYEAAIRECERILKPGGTLIATVSSLGVSAEPDKAFWRFTVASCRYLFGKYFPADRLEVGAFGNVLSGQAFWVGAAAEELTREELEYHDPRYAVIVYIRAKKR